MIKYNELLGRRYKDGTHDCIAIVIDFYKLNYDIDISNYARPTDWNSNKLDLIGKCYEREGFFKLQEWTLEKLQPGDILCMAIGSNVANHMAVYVGENKIVHHLKNRFSNEEILKSYMRKVTCYVIRHKDVKSEVELKNKKTLLEILYERNQVNSSEPV